MLGVMVGAVSITQFSDKFGRRWTFLICNWLYGVVGLGLAFTNSYVAFAFTRFLAGILSSVCVFQILKKTARIAFPISGRRNGRIRPFLRSYPGQLESLFDFTRLCHMGHRLRGSWSYGDVRPRLAPPFHFCSFAIFHQSCFLLVM